MKQRIYIIGAGIGGLTTALSLKQLGFEVQVVESAPAIKPVGAGIVMANNAMQVYKELGLRPKIEAAGYRVSYMRITDAEFNELSTIDLAAFEQRYRVCNIAIHRADLQGILADELGFDQITLGKRLVQVEKGDGYRLHFEDGTEEKAPVLIGADGIHSVVRKQLFPPSTLRNSKQVCWRGICEVDLADRYEHTALEAWGAGRRFGFVRLNPAQVYWYAVADDGTESADLLDLFHDFHPHVLEMITATPAASVFFSHLYDLKPIHQWAEGEACLIGDAAHATTPNLGQGACQAVEDAYVLKKLFAQGLPVEEVFRQYQALRVKKAHQVVKTSWTIGKVSHWQNPLGIGVRNFVMKNLPASVRQKQLEPLFALD